MGKWKYRKPEPFYIQGVCVICCKNKQKPRKRKGQQGFLPYCPSCEDNLFSNPDTRKERLKRKSRRREKREYYKVYEKLSYCESCGFIAKHKCQLDVDHKDGNNQNNEIDNLQTLCANCHRLKTFHNRDWEPRHP